jgi:hypothetical protein
MGFDGILDYWISNSIWFLFFLYYRVSFVGFELL